MGRIKLFLLALLLLFLSEVYAQEIVRFRLILVKTKEEAQEILAELQRGETFSELAKERSIAPSASSGGDVGDINADDLRSEIKGYLLQLKVGETSSIIKAFGGYALIKRELLSEELRAQEHLKKGLQLLDRERFEEATRELKKALTLVPEMDLARLNLGVAYGELGRMDEAIYEFRKLLAQNPNNPLVHNNLAVAYYKKGAFKLAIQHCDEALRLGGEVNPEFLEALKPHRR